MERSLEHGSTCRGKALRGHLKTLTCLFHARAHIDDFGVKRRWYVLRTRVPMKGLRGRRVIAGSARQAVVLDDGKCLSLGVAREGVGGVLA